MHEQFEALLNRIAEGSSVGDEFLADVLARVIVKAPLETSRVEIAAGIPGGGGPAHERKIPQGTVSKAVKALMDEGLLDRGKTGLLNEDGRPVASLQLGTGVCMAGAKVTLLRGVPAAVTTALTRLDGKVLSSSMKSLPGSPADRWQLVAGLIHREVVRLKKRQDEQRSAQGEEPLELFGVGVEVGAHVDRGKIIRRVGEGEYSEVPLGDDLTRRFAGKVPVVVENDVNALAVWALNSGRYPEADLVVVAVFDEGVGGGLIMDGRLRRGGNGMAMEVGHLTVGHAPGSRKLTGAGTATGRRDPSLDLFDPECHCGGVGHVDAFATPARLRKSAGVATLGEIARAPVSVDGVRTPQALCMETAGSVLGRGLAHVVNIVNPSRLVLYLPAELCDIAPAHAAHCYLAAARSEMEHAFSTGATVAHLTPVQLEDKDLGELGARAAAVCVINSFIDHARGLDGCPVVQRRPSARRTADGPRADRVSDAS
jgi:predicted NBD/HSP70 family sugar kinase